MEAHETPKSFDALVSGSEKPVLVDFWADWCSACRMLAPTLQRIAAEFRDRMITIKVNVDKRPNLAARYEVSGIPTVLLFRGGRPVMRFSGALPYDRFKAEVLRALDAS